MTKLCRWHNVINDEDTHPTYTCDEWEIPEEGTDIWCTGWKRGQIIKPYDDGCHVIIGFTVYHCDELMEIMQRWEQEGYTWGLDGVKPKRYQQINGEWREIKGWERK